MAPHSYFKWKSSTRTTSSVGQYPTESRLGLCVRLCQGPTTLTSGSCDRWHRLVHKATFPGLWAALVSTNGMCSKVEMMGMSGAVSWGCSPQARRSRQQTLARPWVVSGEGIFHSTWLSRLLLTQNLSKIHTQVAGFYSRPMGGPGVAGSWHHVQK